MGFVNSKDSKGYYKSPIYARDYYFTENGCFPYILKFSTLSLNIPKFNGIPIFPLEIS